jgi:hypothetical protein
MRIDYIRIWQHYPDAAASLPPAANAAAEPTIASAPQGARNHLASAAMRQASGGDLGSIDEGARAAERVSRGTDGVPGNREPSPRVRFLARPNALGVTSRACRIRRADRGVR